ncbi:dynamin family protein [Oceanirhabdus seepicola]|uniref:Dynamin family protein n=1 Tax=Oceanirhabdus seepicola TaxID=2828781 RepID=A0A9J6P3Q6_9CLOT|nr:dynamin family protein [Oceanirhabdus seepicola]MCM1991319.1 dynamin family protein [Oceanirhabdus seepicola]
MITNDYKKIKQAVLGLYNEFEKVVAKNNKQVNKSIVKQVKDIKNEQFKLMIVGEAKSGKSTFINAYLGKKILPMHEQQCTSSIIKIYCDEKYELVATNAGKGRTTIRGDKAIKEFLKNHAALKEEYRCIPVTSINNELLIKYKGKPQNRTIKEFISAVAKDNIYNLTTEEYDELIKKYIRENSENWKKIITEIEIKYPLSEDMKGIVLIDSPGVNADGNVGVVAEEYMENANAVIFVKSLYGQAIESSSFTNFLKSQSANRHKETMFLVLTGTSNITKVGVANLKAQAVDMYGKTISENKIICVDSKVQLFLNKCKELGREDLVDRYFVDLKKQDKSFAPARLCWLETGKDFEEFENEMEKLSDFVKVHEAIEKFARKANYLLLLSFLDNLKAEYKKYLGFLESQIQLLKESVDDPKELKKKISEKIEEIENIHVKISEGIQDIQSKYEDNLNCEGIIVNTVEEKRKEYERKLESFLQMSDEEVTDNDFKQLELLTFNMIEEVKDLRKKLGEQIIAECNEKLIQMANGMEDIPVEAFSPNFTQGDFEDIKNETYNNADETRDIEEGITFKTTRKVSVHSRSKHLRLVANSISNRFEAITDTLKMNLLNYTACCFQKYREKLEENKVELESDYNSLLEKKATAESILETIKEYESRSKDIKENLDSLKLLKKGVENHVN